MNLFTNLTKGQLAVFLVLIFLVVVMAIPFINSTVVKPVKGQIYEYEPWDPDNTENIKDKIVSLNKEGIELNAQKDMLDSYVLQLNSGYTILNNIKPDDNLKASLISIQPFTILSYDRAYYNSDFKEEQEKLFNNITNLSNVYMAEYKKLVDDLGLSLSYNTNSQNDLLSSNLAEYNFISKQSKPLLTKEDSIQSYKNSLNTGVTQEMMIAFNNGKAKLITADTSLINFLNNRLNYISKRNLELTNELNSAKDSYSKNKLDINKYAVLIGIPLFIVAALLMYVYGIKSSKQLKDELNAQNNFNSADYKTGLSFTLYTITALILILTLLILGLAKVIQENTLAALLGTIAGYLLNNSTDKATPPTANAQPLPPANVSNQPPATTQQPANK